MMDIIERIVRGVYCFICALGIVLIFYIVAFIGGCIYPFTVLYTSLKENKDV